MISSHEQGRLKVVNHSMSTLEMIHSWAKQDNLIRSDPSLYIDLTIVWFQVDQNKSKPALWNEETMRCIAEKWMDIPANFMSNEIVRQQSYLMLASLLNLFWRSHMNISLIRSFTLVLKKAAADIESSLIGGFLKYAVVKPATKPKILSFNGSTRKIVDIHYACSVMIIRRSKASSEDIENFYAMKNANGGLDNYFIGSKETSSTIPNEVNSTF